MPIYKIKTKTLAYVEMPVILLLHPQLNTER